jgi:hypothetical protein
LSFSSTLSPTRTRAGASTHVSSKLSGVTPPRPGEALLALFAQSGVNQRGGLSFWRSAVLAPPSVSTCLLTLEHANPESTTAVAVISQRLLAETELGHGPESGEFNRR